MIKLLRDPMWQFVGVLVAFLALVFSILIWRQSRRKALSYDIISNTPLVSIKEKEKLRGKLQILFDGKPVEAVQLIEVKIVNSGNVPIESKDYERPITLNFGAKAQILTAEVIETNPSNLQPSIDNELTKVKIKPILLNEGSSVVMKMLVNQFNGKDEDIKIESLIVGVKNIEMLGEEKSRKLTIFLGIFDVFLGIIFLNRRLSFLDILIGLISIITGLYAIIYILRKIRGKKKYNKHYVVRRRLS